MTAKIWMGRYIEVDGRPVAVPSGDPHWVTQDRRVALDTIANRQVSTVFLGIDHRADPDGEPILYETMVFKTTNHTTTTWPCSVHDQHCEQHRYTTREQALIGHQQVVADLVAAHEKGKRK